MINQTKPTTSYTNTARPDTGLIWNNATMTWNANTDTWNSTGSLLDNVVKISSSIINVTRPA